MLRFHGKSVRWLAAQIDRAPSSVHTWFQRDMAPKLDDIVPIADALGTTLDFLLRGEEPDELSYSDAARQLLAVVRPLPESQRLEVLGAVQFYLAAKPRVASTAAEAPPRRLYPTG